MNVRQIMNSEPLVCRADTNLAVAAALMWEGDCGILPVVDGMARVLGVVTDRDICIASATRGRQPAHIAVRDVTSGQVVSCRPDDTVAHALKTMKGQRVRRLPVIDEDGLLQGMLSLSDIVQAVGQRGAPSAQAVVDTFKAVCAPRLAALETRPEPAPVLKILDGDRRRYAHRRDHEHAGSNGRPH